jgi:hypothetical protein
LLNLSANELRPRVAGGQPQAAPSRTSFERLDELDKRVEKVLKEWQAACQGADSGGK